jgi:hypothetical protein
VQDIPAVLIHNVFSERAAAEEKDLPGLKLPLVPLGE